jgi:hypothetical protein
VISLLRVGENTVLSEVKTQTLISVFHLPIFPVSKGADGTSIG